MIVTITLTITISSFALNRSISIQYNFVEPTQRNNQAYTNVGSWRTGSFGLHIVAFELDYYFGCIDTNNNNTTRKHITQSLGAHLQSDQQIDFVLFTKYCVHRQRANFTLNLVDNRCEEGVGGEGINNLRGKLK